MGNLYVADRENSRIQVFDSAGLFLRQFSNKDFGSMCSVTIEQNNQKIYAVDDHTFLKLKHRGSDVLIMDTMGGVHTRFGRSSSGDGLVCWYHDIAVDNQQNIYVGDILGNKVQKFKKSFLRLYQNIRHSKNVW